MNSLRCSTAFVRKFTNVFRSDPTEHTTVRMTAHGQGNMEHHVGAGVHVTEERGILQHLHDAQPDGR